MHFLLALAVSTCWASDRVNYPSPDQPGKQLIATVQTLKWGESALSIWRSHGRLFFSKSFGSEDGEHGDAIDKAQWTTDGRFFVIIVEHSSGHSPMMHPIYFWDRTDGKLHSLDDQVGGITGGFTLEPPDIVKGTVIALKNPKAADGQIGFSISLSSAVKNYRSLTNP